MTLRGTDRSDMHYGTTYHGEHACRYEAQQGGMTLRPSVRCVEGGGPAKTRLYFNLPNGGGGLAKTRTRLNGSRMGWGPAKTVMTHPIVLSAILSPLATIVPLPSIHCSHGRHLAIVSEVAHPLLLR